MTKGKCIRVTVSEPRPRILSFCPNPFKLLQARQLAEKVNSNEGSGTEPRSEFVYEKETHTVFAAFLSAEDELQ